MEDVVVLAEAAGPLLTPWQDFYVIVGSSAGALTGLQFVVIALIAEAGGERHDGDSRLRYPNRGAPRRGSAYFGDHERPHGPRSILPGLSWAPAGWRELSTQRWSSSTRHALRVTRRMLRTGSGMAHFRWLRMQSY